MQQSGLILDMYDDPSVLKSLYPEPDAAPDYVKQAHALSADELEKLPDDAYALVMVDGGRSFRKFACIDKGNTEINCELFVKNAAKLPEVAQKTAAENLVRACEWYGVTPSDSFTKLALGLLGAANLAIMGPSVVKGTKQNIHNNLAGVRALEGKGTVVPPSLYKGAEVSGTSLMPNQSPGSLKRAVEISKGTPLTSSVEKGAEVKPDVSEAVKGEQYESAPQFKLPKSLQSRVDVTSKSAHTYSTKTAYRFALRESYPLDSYQQVKEASAYFENWWRAMPPADRHEYCVNLVKRASELGIDVPATVSRYGSETYAPAAEIKIAMDARLMYVNGAARDMLESLWDSRSDVPPDVFCETLNQLDKIAMVDYMWGSHIPDPWASTYGVKQAEDEAWVNGNDYITKSKLEDFGFTGYATLEGSFGAEFATEFRKDPWGVFNSLPLPQKRRITRMATDNAPTGKQHVP